MADLTDHYNVVAVSKRISDLMMTGEALISQIHRVWRVCYNRQVRALDNTSVLGSMSVHLNYFGTVSGSIMYVYEL